MLPETIEQLLDLLARWDRRLRLQQTLRWLPRGIMGGLALGIALAVVSRVQPWLMPRELLNITLVAAAVGLIAALGVVWLARRDPLALARRFDHLFGLKERVSTALEIGSGRVRSPNPEITARQVEDTLTRAKRIDPRAYLPLRLDGRELLILVAMIAAVALLLLLENPQSTVLAEQAALDTAIQQQVDDLEALRDEIANNPDLTDAQREDMLAALDDSIEQLEQEGLSREEAVASLSELAQEMSDIAQSPQIPPSQQQALEEAASQLAEQAQEVAEAMEEGSLEDAAAALEDLAQSLGEMGESAQQDLAEAMGNAADALADTNPEAAEAMQEASDALQEGDPAAAQAALEAAAEAMGQDANDAQQSENSGRQVASQASQQALQDAQSIAQAGGAESPTGQAVDAPQGDTAAPIGQSGEGGDNTLNQAGQSGEGEAGGEGGEGEDAAGSPANISGEGTGEEGEGGLAGGAGDSDGADSEGGFTASGEQIEQGNAPDGEGETEFESIFAPQTIGGEDGPAMQVGGDEPGDVVTEEGQLTETQEGESIVGYDSVFSDYAGAASEALQSDYIPLNLRDVVHDYFSALEPE